MDRCGLSSVGQSNDVIIYSTLITHGTYWEDANFLTDGNSKSSCFITSGEDSQSSVDAKFAYDGPWGKLTLTKKADHTKSTPVSDAFKRYNNEPNNNTVVCKPETGKSSSYIPEKLNFAFCGNLITPSQTIPMCLRKAVVVQHIIGRLESITNTIMT